jgi:Flp pilus assembly protein TadD
VSLGGGSSAIVFVNGLRGHANVSRYMSMKTPTLATCCRSTGSVAARRRRSRSGCATISAIAAFSCGSASTAAYELLAALYARQGNVAAAVARYRDAAARVANPTGPGTMAAILLESAHDASAARAQYESVLARDPHAGIAANNLAWILADAGDLSAAERWAQTAVETCADARSRTTRSATCT